MNKLKELREKKGLTLKELSEALEQKGISISSDSLAKYERGDRKPKYDKWVGIAKFYGVTVPYLQGNTFSQNDIYQIVCKEYIAPIHDPFFENDINWHMHIMGMQDLKKIFSINELQDFTKSVQNFFEDNFQFVFLTELGKKCLMTEKSQDKNVLNEICLNFGDAVQKIDNKLLSTPISEAFDKEVRGKLSKFNQDCVQRNMLRDANKKYIIEVTHDLALAFFSFSEKVADLPENSEISPNNAKKRLKKFVDSGGKTFE